MSDSYDPNLELLKELLEDHQRRIERRFDEQLDALDNKLRKLRQDFEDRVADEDAWARVVAETSSRDRSYRGGARALVSGDPGPTSTYLVTREDDREGRRSPHFGS